MSQAAEYGDFEWTSPVVHIGEYALTFMNTYIRTFGGPWEELDHVEYTDDSGAMSGMTVTQELMDTLLEHGFPYSFQYYPDEATQKWWLKLVGKKLQADIEGLENGIYPTA